MSKTYKIKNLGTSDITLRDGEQLIDMYICNTTVSEQTFNLKIDDVYVLNGVKIPAYVTLHLDGDIYFDTNRMTISAGSVDSLDITYKVQ